MKNSCIKRYVFIPHLLEMLLVGEGFILLTRGYGFMEVYHPPFDTLKIGTSTDYIRLKLYR